MKTLAGMPDDDIDYTDIPPLPDDFFKTAVRGWLPLEAHTVDLALDVEVYGWLVREGRQNARAINHVLRREMQQAAAAKERTVPAPVTTPSMSKAS